MTTFPAERQTGPAHRLVCGALAALVASSLLLVSSSTAHAAPTTVTATVSDAAPAYGTSIKVRGKVTGRKPGATIQLWVANDGPRRKLATTRLNDRGRFAFTWAPPRTFNGKTYALQVVAAKFRTKAAVYGDYLLVTSGDQPWDPESIRPAHLAEVNDARAERGLPALTMVPEYTEVANQMAQEAHENGGYLPEDGERDPFPEGVDILGICQAPETTRDSLAFPAQEWDVDPQAKHVAVGIYKYGGGKANVVILTLSHQDA